MAKEAVKCNRVGDLALKIWFGQTTRNTDIILDGLVHYSTWASFKYEIDCQGMDQW